MADAPVLVLRGFGVAFGGTPVLASVDLELPRAGLTVLVGPAGSGKSTLLRTLAGLNQSHPSLSTWGEATLSGRPLIRPAPPAAEAASAHAKGGVGLVMQHTRFFVNTVRENLVSALPNRERLDRAEQTARARAMLRGSGLASLVELLDAEVVTLPQPLQRMLAIVRATASAPAVLLADEPTTGLDDDAAIDVIALLRLQAATRAVLFVTHNQRHAMAAGGTAVLLAGGEIVERAPTSMFFRAPATHHGRSFLATGHCALPSPSAKESDLDDASPRPARLPACALEALRADVGPRGFFWVVPRKLGGLPRPGIVAELEHDLAGLGRLGVDVLVTLEERPTVDPAALASARIRSIHFPVPDMGAPSIEATRELCAVVAKMIEDDHTVAFHCRAGLGRTGTLLACQLIWGGDGAVRAIERVRQINPRCIQSDEQIAFLRVFEDALRRASSLPPHSPTPT